MKAQNFFDKELLAVIDAERVRRTLRVKVRTREVRVGVKVRQQVVRHHSKFVTSEVVWSKLQWYKFILYHLITPLDFSVICI